MNAALSYHRRDAARCLASGFWTHQHLKFHEYGWLRSFDRSPKRPLQRLVAAERRARA